MNDDQSHDRIAHVRRYFELVDARDSALLDLFTDDVELHFPKYGGARGKEAVARVGAAMGPRLQCLEHDIANFSYIVAGDHVVAEGRESGRMADGRDWPDGIVSQGRFCNVFVFDGSLISAVRIYVDPDFAGDDTATLQALRESSPRD